MLGLQRSSCCTNGNGYILDHSYGDWTEVTASTCTAKGSERRDCANCDAFETREIAISGHKPVEGKATPATCTAPGKTGGSSCSVCGEVFEAPADIPALGHDYRNWTSNGDASFFKYGTITSRCNRCGDTQTKTDEGSSTFSRIIDWLFRTVTYLSVTFTYLFILIFNKLAE